MGWTSMNASYYKNGRIDRIKEVNDLLTSENDSYKWEVLKSCLVGSTVYSANKRYNKKENTEKIFGVITLTSVDSKDWFNFSYKIIEESAGAHQCKCPLCIIKLLSPIETLYSDYSESQEWAARWRSDCIEYNKKKNDNSLNKMPYGSKIRMNYWKKDEPTKILTKTNIWSDGYWKYTETTIKRMGYEVI